MSTTTGLSLEQLKAKRKELISQGKELSTSKELGKIENAIKVLQPSKYDTKQVASAQLALKSSTQAPVTAAGASGSSGTPSGTSSATTATSDLEKLLADKNAALVKATSNINDNPWYSEATRTGKLAKLNNIAQLEIGNIQNQLAAQKQAEQQAFQNNISTQQLAMQQQTANKPNVSQVTDNAGNVTAYDSITGKVLYTLQGVGGAKTTGGGGGDDNGTYPPTTKYLAKAESYLEEADAMTAGTQDTLLSRDEQMSAYNKILALVGGDATLAQQVFQQAWDTGGYGNYGE